MSDFLDFVQTSKIFYPDNKQKISKVLKLSNKSHLPDDLITRMIIEASEWSGCDPYDKVWFYFSKLKTKRSYVKGLVIEHKVPLWYECNLLIPLKSDWLAPESLAIKILGVLTHELKHVADHQHNNRIFDNNSKLETYFYSEEIARHEILPFARRINHRRTSWSKRPEEIRACKLQKEVEDRLSKDGHEFIGEIVSHFSLKEVKKCPEKSERSRQVKVSYSVEDLEQLPF